MRVLSEYEELNERLVEGNAELTEKDVELIKDYNKATYIGHDVIDELAHYIYDIIQCRLNDATWNEMDYIEEIQGLSTLLMDIKECKKEVKII